MTVFIHKKRKYASIIADTGRTTFVVKDYEELLDLAKPYRARKYRAIASPTGISIFNLKIEYADEVTAKLKAYLEDAAKLKPLTK